MAVVNNLMGKFEKFLEQLQIALRAPLPGIKAQKMMAPKSRRFSPTDDMPTRQSAVLLLLYPGHAGNIYLLFTLRTATLSHHGGEISFPGGGLEAGDLTLGDTALREVEEEIALPTEYIRILGSITPLYIEHSQNMVHPFVGWVDTLPPLHPNKAEVDKIIEVQVRKLLDPESLGLYTWQHNNQSYQAPCYCIDNYIIWGATAMMASELMMIIRQMEEYI